MFNVLFLPFPSNILMQIIQSGNHEFVFSKVVLFELLHKRQRRKHRAVAIELKLVESAITSRYARTGMTCSDDQNRRRSSTRSA